MQKEWVRMQGRREPVRRKRNAGEWKKKEVTEYIIENGEKLKASSFLTFSLSLRPPTCPYLHASRRCWCRQLATLLREGPVRAVRQTRRAKGRKTDFHEPHALLPQLFIGALSFRICLLHPAFPRPLPAILLAPAAGRGGRAPDQKKGVTRRSVSRKG